MSLLFAAPVSMCENMWCSRASHMCRQGHGRSDFIYAA